MTANRALILMLILQTVVMAHAQSPNLIGKWNVEITFANEDHRSRGEANSVTFSSAVEFMIGNVGRDAGTLMFNGRFETADLIKGEVEFSPLVGDRPSKHGTFKAARAGGG